MTEQISDETLLDLHRRMVRIRLFEETAGKLMEDGKIPGALHLYVGQEAVAAGVMVHLSDDDWITSTHRGHGHLIAKGGEFDRMFAELYGKATGYCKGKGGSMHICAMELGMLGANGIVGAGIPLATGSAMAHQVRRTGGLAVAFFGDGALAEGVLHESLNLAALWRLPALFVCENNGWSEFSPTARQFTANVRDLAAAFGIDGEAVDGNDAAAVAEAAGRLAGAVRAGEGPRVLECITRRVRGHYEGDPQKYRTDADANPDADPLARSLARLKQARAKQAEIDALAAEVEAEIEAAVEAARAAPQADFGAALADVYTQERA